MDEAPWSNKNLLARIDARMIELGADEAELVRSGKFPATKDLRRNLDTQSPTLRTLERWAENLGWTLPELMGIRPQRVLALDSAKLRVAVHLALIAVGNNQMRGDFARRAALLAILMERAYYYVDLAVTASGAAPDPSSSTFEHILERLKSGFEKKDFPGS